MGTDESTPLQFLAVTYDMGVLVVLLMLSKRQCFFFISLSNY